MLPRFIEMLSRGMILLFCFYSVHGDDQPYCYMEDTNPYLYFGTKTSYEIAHAPDMVAPQNAEESCKPVYVWALIRHGTRYSDKLDTKKLNELQHQILSNYENEKRGALCLKDLKNIKLWMNQNYGKTTDDLAPQGKIELSKLGKRLAIKFEDLIANRSDSFRFQTTVRRRTKDSAAAMIEGMFGIDKAATINISVNEEVLHFLSNSEEYQRKVSKNNETYKERELFLKSKSMQILAREVSERLGFNETLPQESIKEMYFSCAFENAWAPNSNPAFCAAFNKQQLQLLEYCYFDLPDYFEVGYGTRYNIKLHNPVLEDLLSKMTYVINYDPTSKEETDLPKGHLYFSHAATLSHTVTKLSLYRDEEPLLHSNYGSRKQKAEWSMYRISPFSGNLIAVLHECERSREHKIALYHNEYLVQLPGCPNTLCPWSQFYDSIRSNNDESNEEENSSAQGLSMTVNRTLYFSIFSLLMLIFMIY